MQNQLGEYKGRIATIGWRRNRPQVVSPVTHAASIPPESEQRRSDYMQMIEAQEAYLLRAALRFCRNRRDDAQDLVQETLIRGYEAYLEGRFIEGSNGRAWFMRILTNLFLNENRRQKWKADIDLDSLVREGISRLEALHASPEDRPDTALLNGVLDEPLEKAMDSLTEELRVCAMLVDAEEFTYAEAAVILNIPVGTVRSRLWRARQVLHVSLLEYAQNHRRI